MFIIRHILTAALGLFLVSSGIAKFAGGHVFQYIEHRSGIDIFHPVVNHATGVAEILVGLLILVPATRLVGALGASVIMAGAIGFHLSPWLGVSTPTGMVEGASAPWTEADFTTSTTPVTFVLALVTFAGSAWIARTEWRRRSERRVSVGGSVDRTPVTV